MRLFKNKWFARSPRQRISTTRRCARLIDADLGGGVIKQRIARAGEGGSGGFRSIVLYRRGKLAFFVFGFAKNRTANIKKDELRSFKKLAKEMLALDDRQIARLKKIKALSEEVMCDG